MPNVDTKQALTDITKSLKKRHKLTLKDGRVEDVYIGIAFEEIRSGSNRLGGYFKTPTGKLRCRVGENYSDVRAVNFKELNSGGFSIDKIADRLAETYRTKMAIKKRRQEQQSRAERLGQAVKDIAAKYDTIESYNLPTQLSFRRGTGAEFLQFKIDHITPENADKLTAAAIALGIIKPKGAK